jgi:hypothetical protein
MFDERLHALVFKVMSFVYSELPLAWLARTEKSSDADETFLALLA